MKLIRYLILISLAGPLPGWSAPECSPHPLNILLTNDDGFQAQGIRAMRNALQEHNHNVTVVAPDRNFSASSASITRTTVSVTEAEPGVFAVSGSPATSVILGVLAILGEENRPSLIVSGINSGPNVGSATPLSGTVGATILATIMPGPIAAIAASTALPNSDPQSAENVEHYRRVASFVTRLIDTLIQRSCGQLHLLSRGLALNVNYPALPPEKIAGVVVGTQGRDMPYAFGYEQPAQGQYQIEIERKRVIAPLKGTDTEAFVNGFITIVPLDGDYTAPVRDQQKLRFLQDIVP